MTFATKPRIGITMAAAALDAGVPRAWVLGDKVDGGDKSLRIMLESRDKPYGLSIRGNERLTMGDFRRTAAEDRKGHVFMTGRSWPKVPAREACWNGQRRGGFAYSVCNRRHRTIGC